MGRLPVCVHLVFLVGLIAPCACVVVLAYLGNSTPLLVWGLLCAVSGVWFLLPIRRAVPLDDEGGASKIVINESAG